jgi:hypothetical protein
VIAFPTFNAGRADINNSAWTNATFTNTYTDIPMVMVTQNDDDGGQDPQYPRARNVTTTTMQFRYCEQDDINVCNSHTSERVHWFALDAYIYTVPGSISIDSPLSESFIAAAENQTLVIDFLFNDYLQIETEAGYSDDAYTTLQISNR